MRETVGTTEYDRLFADVVYNTGLHAALVDHEKLARGSPHLFDHVLLPRMKASNQHFTGLCWAFAGLNLLRRLLAARYDLEPDFCLSQTYLLYWDKYEKANNFLVRVVQAKDRELHHLLDDPIPDGGAWETFEHLVLKYGVVPASAMRENATTVSTYELNKALRLLLRQSAHRMRQGSGYGRVAVLTRVKRLLNVCLGTPPAKDQCVTWVYRSSAPSAAAPSAAEPSVGRVVTLRTTPLELLTDHVGFRGDAYTLISNVVDDQNVYQTPHKYHVRYECDGEVNFLGIQCQTPKPFVNLDEATFRTRVLDALRDDFPVWFGCEFDAMRASEAGLLCGQLMRYERAIGESPFARTRRISARGTDVNHAMLLTGCHGAGERLQVENSHGDDIHEGYLSMDADWFREHVFMAVVPVQESDRNITDESVLRPWDIFGTVARLVT